MEAGSWSDNERWEFLDYTSSTTNGPVETVKPAEFILPPQNGPKGKYPAATAPASNPFRSPLDAHATTSVKTEAYERSHISLSAGGQRLTAIFDDLSPTDPFYNSRERPAVCDSNKVPFKMSSKKTSNSNHPRQSTMPPPASAPSIIAVMGKTGSGKSTFISKASGCNLKVNRGLGSCTKDCIEVEFDLNGRKVVLVDTPGFDDTDMSDVDVLDSITHWLNLNYGASGVLSGFVYCHDIREPRMSGSQMKNLSMFSRLTGSQNMDHVLLLITKVESTSKEEREPKEKDLIGPDGYWEKMINHGARVRRHDNTKANALEILWPLTKMDGMVPHVTDEMMNGGKVLKDTDVGVELNQQIIKEREMFEKKMEREMRRLYEAHKAERESERQESEERIQALQQKIDANVKRQEKLNQKREEQLEIARNETARAHQRLMEGATELASTKDQLMEVLTKQQEQARQKELTLKQTQEKYEKEMKRQKLEVDEANRKLAMTVAAQRVSEIGELNEAVSNILISQEMTERRKQQQLEQDKQRCAEQAVQEMSRFNDSMAQMASQWTQQAQQAQRASATQNVRVKCFNMWCLYGPYGGNIWTLTRENFAKGFKCQCGAGLQGAA